MKGEQRLLFSAHLLYSVEHRPVRNPEHALPVQKVPEIRRIGQQQDFAFTDMISLEQLDLLDCIIQLCFHPAFVPELLVFFPVVFLIPGWYKVQHQA
jgi:hypothetical protein